MPIIRGTTDLPQGAAWSRRQMLQSGTVGVSGLALADLLRMEQTAAATPPPSSRRRARSVIVLYLNGGPSQLDSWDMKPDAPAEIRGSFQPIQTVVPDVSVSEHFPRMARLANRYAVIRSMCHREGDHPKANYWTMTGAPMTPAREAEPRKLSRLDRPHVGSVLARLWGGSSALPSFVMLPDRVRPTTEPHAGQHAGFLGPAYDPYLIESDPNLADFAPGSLQLDREVTAGRLAARRALLGRIEPDKPIHGDPRQPFDVYAERALDLLGSSAVQRAFDIDQEPARVRENYGRHEFGQSALLARRLVEAGVRLVHVNWVRLDDGKGGQGYDTHRDHLEWCRDELFPPTDRAFGALVEDLQERGLLEETLVLLLGEFGRTPRFNKDAGRDHWPYCYSMVLAGGGIRGGMVYGASDKIGAHPAANPVGPQDLVATFYHCQGIDSHTVIYDLENRPYQLVDGQPIHALL
jgi:hypothetical protein